MNSRLTTIAGVFLLISLAGCSGVVGPGGGGGSESTVTLTPAPIPENVSGSVANPGQSSASSRFQGLRPTCERPPELIVHIQLGALRTNDPRTNEGINATWRFAAPSNREATGSYERFVNIVTERFQPLLNAETMTFGPLRQTGMDARQRVTVTTVTGETQSYVWYLEKQTDAPYEGCWMTTGVRPSLENINY